MATAAGLRFAIAGLPTPGSGLDDQDRHAIAGVVQPANSITQPAIGGSFSSKQRAAIAGIQLPDNQHDEQDRHHIAGVIQPSLSNLNISAQQRAFLAGIPGWPGGSGFTSNDRAHVAGIYPYQESSVFIERFDIEFTWAPTWTDRLIEEDAVGHIDIVAAGDTAAFQGYVNAAPGRGRISLTVGWDHDLYDAPARGGLYTVPRVSVDLKAGIDSDMYTARQDNDWVNG